MAIFTQPQTAVLHCCYPACEAPVTDQMDQMPLCTHHCLKVYKRVASKLEPEQLHAWLKTKVRANPVPSKESPMGFVYVIRLGDRVKIGHSLNPTQRFKQLPLEEVLAITRGSSSDEKAAHRQFAHLRTTGEWFKAEPELLGWAKNLPRHRTA